MDTVIEEDEFLYGWIAAKIKYDLCGHIEISTHHTSCERLECGECGTIGFYDTLEVYK